MTDRATLVDTGEGARHGLTAGGRRRARLEMGLLLVATLCGRHAEAFETDQFLALDVEIEEATEVLNRYLEDEIKLVLKEVNSGFRIKKCEKLPPMIYRHLFANLVSSRLKRFLENSPDVDRVPGDEVGYWEYLHQSIYRKPIFPYIVPMSSTVNVGDVHLGVDKFGHMLGEGRRYYKRYTRALERGIDEEEALRTIVVSRLRWERVLFGGLSNGVLSFADLEANYQGMRLALDMCSGSQPYLARIDDKWTLTRPIHIEHYVVPALDESFNPSRFPRGRWKRVRPILLNEHCPKVDSPVFQDRLERYRELHEPSPSRAVLEDFFTEREIRTDEHSFLDLCTLQVHGSPVTTSDTVERVVVETSAASSN